MKKSASAAVFLLVALALAACGPTTPDPVTPDPVTPAPVTPPVTTPVPTPVDPSIIGTGSVTVQGYVQSQNGGAAVVGSAVTVTDASNAAVGSGVTDASGKFSLKVNPGFYTLKFAKTGYAGSVVEGFPVTAGMTAPLNVIEKVAFDPSFPTAPPALTVTSLVGTTETAFPTDPAKALSFNASTGFTLHYIADSAKSSNAAVSLSPTNIYAAVGLTNIPGSGFLTTRATTAVVNDPQFTKYDTTLKVSTAALGGVRGASYLNLVAYDFNYNRINKYLPINITDDQPVTAPIGAFLSSSARAVTLAQKLNGNGFNTPVKADGIVVKPDGASAETSSMWVDLAFNYQSGIQGALDGNLTGYRIFTSDDGKTFNLLRTLPGTALSARDSSPTLAPGKKVYYFVQAYTSTQSIDSPVMDTTPLDSYVMTSIGPANHSTGASVTPTLSWSLDKKVGDYRKFYVNIFDYPSQGGNCVWGQLLCGNVTDAANNVYLDDGSTPGLSVSGLNYSVPFNQNGKSFIPKLDAYHSYTLDVTSAAFSKDGKAVSIGHDYFNTFYTLATCNFGGPVCEGLVSTFTTGDGSN